VQVKAATPGAVLAGRFVWLTEYRELLTSLLRREVRAKYKGSGLGILWSFLHPLLMIGVYTLVFSVLWKAVTVPHYPLFVLTGLAAWAFFQAAVQSASGSLVANAQIIKKVWFPREVIPVSIVLSQAITLGVMLAVILPINLVVVPEARTTFLLAAPILAGFLGLTLGFAWVLATANVFFRDVEHFLAVLFLPWFFLTPVFYDLEQLPGAADHSWLIDVLRYGNPVTPYVEALRGVVLQGVVPGPTLLAYVFVVGPGLAALGLWLFQRYEDRFAIEL
jgi:lipopolysaccharide transport system permease protein